MIISSGNLHIMRLVEREANEEGWAKVSKQVWPIIENLPDELIERQPSDDGGQVRLTHDGKVVLKWAQAIKDGADR